MRPIVAFKLTKKGYEYIGEMNYQKLIDYVGQRINLYEHNRDKQGRYCKPYLVDDSGNEVNWHDLNSLVGYLDIDGEYESYFCKYVDDLSDHLLEVVAADLKEIKSVQLEDYLNVLGYFQIN